MNYLPLIFGMAASILWFLAVCMSCQSGSKAKAIKIFKYGNRALLVAFFIAVVIIVLHAIDEMN